MTEHDEWVWSEERARATRILAAHNLRPDDEQAILNVFQDKPWTVREHVDQLAADIDAGQTIRYPWSVLRQRLTRDLPDIRITGAHQREQRIRNSETWLHNAGLYLDREEAMLDILFGANAPLHPYAQAVIVADEDNNPTREYQLTGDTTLAQRFIDLWHSERTRGQQAETATLAYQTKPWIHWHERKQLAAAVNLHELIAKHQPQPEPVAASDNDDIPF
jgi:hypothetical protein